MKTEELEKRVKLIKSMEFKDLAVFQKQIRKATLKEVQSWVEANHDKDVIWVVPFYEWLEKEVKK